MGQTIACRTIYEKAETTTLGHGIESGSRETQVRRNAEADRPANENAATPILEPSFPKAKERSIGTVPSKPTAHFRPIRIMGFSTESPKVSILGKRRGIGQETFGHVLAIKGMP